MLTSKIVLIGRWLRCHSQMFTVWMTSIGKWLKMSWLVECGSFSQMILFSPCHVLALLPCHQGAWWTTNGSLRAQERWVFQLRMPRCWLTACNSCQRGQAGSPVTACKAEGWDWQSDGSRFPRADSQRPLLWHGSTSAIPAGTLPADLQEGGQV